MRRWKLVPALGLALAGVGATALPAADPFYLDLLRDGVHHSNRGAWAEAARSLRVACFGLLDEPGELAVCLARLGVAQHRSADLDGFRETFRRAVEVEERFGAWSGAEIPPEVLADFEQRAAAAIPAPTLEAVPAFRHLATPAGTRAAPRGQPTRRASPPPGAAPTEPTEPVVEPSSPPRPRPLTPAERQKLAEARRLLTPEARARDVRQAYDLAREVATEHADSQAAQHLAAEGAYRLSRWQDAVTWFRRGGEPGEGAPELLFYFAVSLYESGDRNAAAATLRRALPRLQRSPYVEGYAKKILGE
jgi:hypothetical protein